MKNLIFLLAIIVFIAIACTPKASPAVTEATIPTSTAVSKDTKTIEAGHTIFTTKCTRCHKEKPIQKWTYEKLRPTLAVMVKRAKLDNTEIQQLTAYVYANSKK
jgi:cytochrome c2